MDVGSIISNALGSIIASFAVVLIINVSKQLRTRIKQRRMQTKKTLDEALHQSQEYKDILHGRKFYRLQAFAALIFLMVLTIPLIFRLVLYGAIEFHFKSIWDGISVIGLFTSLILLIPLLFYYGYAPILSQEIELKRQENRARTFKEAYGAIPYGYIGQNIVFPTMKLLWLLFCIVSFVCILPFSPDPLHVPLALAIPIVIISSTLCIYITRLQIKKIYRAVKNIKNVPDIRKAELRRQFIKNEFEQNKYN